ncbi:hypothetical protein HDU80_001173 [Chytriomyces hyalinus]|nr:hypothetical protein HDU80_001173 [Chytriomyces hyalinus]
MKGQADTTAQRISISTFAAGLLLGLSLGSGWTGLKSWMEDGAACGCPRMPLPVIPALSFQPPLPKHEYERHKHNDTHSHSSHGTGLDTIPLVRIGPNLRRFNSTLAEIEIERVSTLLRKGGDSFNASLATLFTNCWPNTLDTTVLHFSDNWNNLDAFVITGDIAAMWLRDSTNQVAPYLHLLSKTGPGQEKMIQLFVGVILRQAKSINIFPYANAFLYNSSDAPGWPSDKVHPQIPTDADIPTHEAKYELDSLCAFLKISNRVFESLSPSTKHHALRYIEDPVWIKAVQTVIDTMRIQQTGTLEELGKPAYKFQRMTDTATETLLLGGIGVPAKRVGLIKSQFRPSDDAATLPFNIASNAMATVELERLAKNLRNVDCHLKVAELAEDLAKEVRAAINQYGTIQHPKYGEIFAYEVDGYGSYYLMDDANVPSLLSLPYLGFIDSDDPLYLRTRKFILSDANPYFFAGSAGNGVGGPHCGLGMIWPMSIIMRGLTSTSKAEQKVCLDMLLSSATSTGFMHESFWKDDVEDFTRHHFAWANALLGEFVLKYVE